MITRLFKKIFTIATIAATAAACSTNSGPVSDTIIGEKQSELKNKVAELMETAGTDSSKVEFAQIRTSIVLRPNDNTTVVSIQIINPKDNDKMEEFQWSDNKDRRNHTENLGITVSESLSGDVIDEYEGYKDMLFDYGYASKFINKMPEYCKEALEASGYKDKGYVKSFSIEVDGAMISVGNKDSNTTSKTYRIDEEGNHIIQN